MFPNQPPPWERRGAYAARLQDLGGGQQTQPDEKSHFRGGLARPAGLSPRTAPPPAGRSRTRALSVFRWKPYMASAALADAVVAISGISKLPGRPGSGACSSCNYQSSCSWATIAAPWMTFYPHSRGFKAAVMDSPAWIKCRFNVAACLKAPFTRVL